MNDDDFRLSRPEVDYLAGADIGYHGDAVLLAREVQELRHLHDNVTPDLRRELDVANAYLAELLKERA